MATPSWHSRAQQAADLAACRELLSTGSHSFHLASLLLPRRMRAAATALYAFCRLADDAVDLRARSDVNALDELRGQLDRIYAMRPDDLPMERMFARVVHDYDIPRTLLEALVEGFEWDTTGRRYHDLAGINAYAARVAGSVGVLMTLLMGVRDPAVLARACDLGIAMQLTNIARDVGQDARSGRLYLPAEWLLEAGIDPDAWMAHPQFTPALAGVIERLLCAADGLYARASAGIARLPGDCRAGIHAARLLYAEIGHQLRRQGLDSVSRRAHVGLARKLRMVIAALSAARISDSVLVYTPLEEARFMIDAVSALPARSRLATETSQSNAEWVITLFERLQQRDQRLALESSAH